MALKPFNELVKVDVLPYCDTRGAKDESGKTIKVPYLSWAKCAKLLHDNGAESVWYAPCQCPETKSYLCPALALHDRELSVPTQSPHLVAVPVHGGLSVPVAPVAAQPYHSAVFLALGPVCPAEDMVAFQRVIRPVPAADETSAFHVITSVRPAQTPGTFRSDRICMRLRICWGPRMSLRRPNRGRG
jgi:hypothetical protein